MIASPYRLPPRRSAVAPQAALPAFVQDFFKDSASGPSIFRGHLCVHSRYGPELAARTPYGGKGACQWASDPRFPSSLPSKPQGLLPRRVYPPLKRQMLDARRVEDWRADGRSGGKSSLVRSPAPIMKSGPPPQSRHAYDYGSFLPEGACGLFSLRLHVDLSAPLPPIVKVVPRGAVPSTGVQQPASQVLPVHSRLSPISRCCRLYGLPMLRRSRGGLLQMLSWRPRHRTVERYHGSASASLRYVLSSKIEDSASGLLGMCVPLVTVRKSRPPLTVTCQ